MSTLLISYPINLGSTKQQSKNIEVGAIDLHHCVALVMLLKPVLLSGHVTWMSAGIAHFYYFLPTCYRILDWPSLLANMSLHLYPWWGLFIFLSLSVPLFLFSPLIFHFLWLPCKHTAADLRQRNCKILDCYIFAGDVPGQSNYQTTGNCPGAPDVKSAGALDPEMIVNQHHCKTV